MIESVFMFKALLLLAELQERGVRIGTASSVRAEQWARAMIYPEVRNSDFVLTEAQREMLAPFALHLGRIPAN